MKIKFTREELKWIERTADEESARAMFRFTDLINKTNIKNLNESELAMLPKISKELIDLYTFLRELRTKLELWDCRYDINTEIEVKDNAENTNYAPNENSSVEEVLYNLKKSELNSQQINSNSLKRVDDSEIAQLQVHDLSADTQIQNEINKDYALEGTEVKNG